MTSNLLTSEPESHAGATHGQNTPLLLARLSAFSEVHRQHANHSKRVRAVALRVGEDLELSSAELTDLGHAAILHDVGKLSVSAATLAAPRALLDHEWVEMRKHSGAGSELAREYQYSAAVVGAILYHHERFDGRGYPDGLAGPDIPLLARIITLADAWDTMISMRGYNEPRQISGAIEEVERCAGTHFDPHVAEVFLKRARQRFR